MPGDLNDAELTGFGYGTDPLDRTFTVDYGAVYDTVATPYLKRAVDYQPINQEPMGRDYRPDYTNGKGDRGGLLNGYQNNYPYGGPLNALAGAENPYYINDGVTTAVGPYGRGAIQNPYGSDTHIQRIGPSMSIPPGTTPPLLKSMYPVNMLASNYERPSITERFSVGDAISAVTSDTTAIYVFIFMIIVMIVVISLQSYNFSCEKSEMYRLFKSMLESKK